jgi:hypothetical protein
MPFHIAINAKKTLNYVRNTILILIPAFEAVLWL